MSFHFKKRKYGIIYRYVVIAIGIIINITFGLIVKRKIKKALNAIFILEKRRTLLNWQRRTQA